MTERIISVSVDSFPRSTRNAYDDLGALLSTDAAQTCVSGLHYPVDLLGNIYKLEELRNYISGPNPTIEDATIIADLSLSGGYAAANQQLNVLKSYNPGAKMKVVVSHALANRGISALVDEHQKTDEIEFLLTGILPEDVLDGEGSYDNVKESFYLDPETFTEHIVERIKKINARYSEIASTAGVIGVYGSARYASIPRDDLEYVGAGISDDGGIYKSEGVFKHSTKLKVAAETCDEIVVGKMIIDHPDGPTAGLIAIVSQLY